jgi:hypothetical protein
MGRRKVDWSEVEPLYRADVLSVSEIARQFKVTEGAIRYYAKQHKWKRDLGAKVRAKTKEKLIQDLANDTTDPTDTTNPQRGLDGTTIQAGKKDDAKRRTAMLKSVGVSNRAATMRDLATAARTWVGLERQAFSIVEEKEPPPPPLPEPRTLEELRVALLAKMEEFGLSPFDLTEPIGVENRLAQDRSNPELRRRRRARDGQLLLGHVGGDIRE